MQPLKEFNYLRGAITCVLNALDRDGEAGQSVRKEMADELRLAFGNFIEASEAAPVSAGTIDTQIQRYAPGDGYYSAMDKAEGGEYVLYANHLQHTAAADRKAREDVARALGLPISGMASFAWSYLLTQIEECAKCEEELSKLRAATAPVSAVPDDERANFEHWWHEGAHPFRDIAKRKNCQLNEETAWIVWQAAGAPVSAAEPQSLKTIQFDGPDDPHGVPAGGQELPALTSVGFPGSFAVWDDGKLTWLQGPPEKGVCLYTTNQIIDHAIASVKADRAMRQPQGDDIRCAVLRDVMAVLDSKGKNGAYSIVYDMWIEAVAAKQAGKEGTK